MEVTPHSPQHQRKGQIYLYYLYNHFFLFFFFPVFCFFFELMGCVGSLPRRFPLFNFLCLLVSSVSDFHLDTGRAVVDTLGSLFSRAVGREGCCKQILLVCACSVSSTLGLPLLAVHTAQALCSSTGELSEAGPWLHAPPLSKPLRLGAQEALRGADLVGPAFCALPRSE